MPPSVELLGPTTPPVFKPRIHDPQISSQIDASELDLYQYKGHMRNQADYYNNML